MTLDQLQAAMVAAFKERNMTKKEVLSSVLGAVKKTAIDRRCKDNITEELVDEVILKEKKVVQEMIDTCPEDRTELLAGYTAKLAIIDEIAPVLLENPAEIEARITTLLAENGLEATKKNRGTIMKVVMPAMKGKADMKVVNTVITGMLQ